MTVRKIIGVLAACYIGFHLCLVLFQRDLIFARPHDQKGDPPPGVAERVQIVSSDRIRLNGWWVTPETAERRVALLYCHGNAATLSHLAHVATLFKEMGLHALLFDYRGYGASDPADVGEQAVGMDSQAAYDWIKSARGFKDDDIVVWGHSLGAAIAARLVTTRDPRAVITEGAFSSMYDMARYRYPFALIFPWMLRDRFDVAAYLGSRSAPLLMLHAEHDTIIPIEYGRRAFDAAAEPKQWLQLNEIGHNDFPSVAHLYRSRILEFIDKAQSISGGAPKNPRNM